MKVVVTIAALDSAMGGSFRVGFVPGELPKMAGTEKSPAAPRERGRRPGWI